MKKTKKNSMPREQIQIDATDQAVGRVASKVAQILCGKNKPTYDPSKLDGDYVKIINASKVKFSGKKIEKKVYKHYSGYPGGLKIKKMNELFNESPEKVMEKAILRMLPKNKLRFQIIKRLKITK